MEYLLLISADEEVARSRVREGVVGTFDAWITDLERRGVLRTHAGLHDSGTATTVRLRDGEVLLTDGPFAEGREQVGGLAIVDCADLDEAVAIAAAHPAATFGQVEVRPVR
jgi:hypothetical protein